MSFDSYYAHLLKIFPRIDRQDTPVMNIHNEAMKPKNTGCLSVHTGSKSLLHHPAFPQAFSDQQDLWLMVGDTGLKLSKIAFSIAMRLIFHRDA
jgi:hypothetical protein